MDNLGEIREELKGRTGLESEFEEDLFERIDLVEEDIKDHGSIVPTLEKVDFYAAVILIALGIGTVIVSAFFI